MGTQAAVAAGVVVGMATAICLAKWAARRGIRAAAPSEEGQDRAGDRELRWYAEPWRAFRSGYRRKV